MVRDLTAVLFELTVNKWLEEMIGFNNHNKAFVIRNILWNLSF